MYTPRKYNSSLCTFNENPVKYYTSEKKMAFEPKSQTHTHTHNNIICILYEKPVGRPRTNFILGQKMCSERE